MALKWFGILAIIILNCLPIYCVVPDCGTITISCDLPDIHCCEGPCCPLLHQYQLPLSQQPPLPDHADPVIITNSDPNPDPISSPPPQKPAPKVGEQCTSELPKDQQCDNGGTPRSTRCKFDGTADSEGRLLGICKINPSFSGCTADTDCYKINNICNNGKCVDKFYIPKAPKIKPPINNVPNNGVKLPPIDGPKNNFVPIIHAAKGMEGNLDDHDLELKGGTFERELHVPLSEQAQVLGIGVAVVIILCVILTFIRKLYRQRKQDAIRGRRRNRGPDMTDYGVDDADVDWSDDKESTEERPEIIRNGRRSHAGFDVEALMNAPRDFSSSSEFDNGI